MARRKKDQKVLQVFGARVRAVREARGLTQQRLSEILGVRASTVSQIETGDMSPTLTTIATLARALNVPLADLFATEGDVGAANAEGPEAELLVAFRAVPEERRMLAPALLRALRD